MIGRDAGRVDPSFSGADPPGRAVEGLRKDDFHVFEGGVQQELSLFRHEDIPLSVGLAIDNSGSMHNKRERVNSAALTFARESNPEDETFIVNFDDSVYLEQEFTGNINDLINALSKLDTRGETALYDAVYLAVDEKLKGETGRKAIVVITDGEDTSSKIRKNEAIETAQRKDVIIYGIGVRGGFGTDFGVLRKFAEETGGSFFSPRAKLAEIQAAFRSINEDLQGQYSLAYVSTNKRRDGAFRTVEIRCKATGLRVRTRKGYYAPKG